MSDRGPQRPSSDGPDGPPWWASVDGATRVEPGPLADDGDGNDERHNDANDDDHDDHEHSDGHLHGMGGGPDACTVCPICSLIRVVGESRPELVMHVVEAMKHLTLAAKAVIDAQADLLGRPSGGLEDIPLDD